MLQLNKVNAGLDSWRHIMQMSKLPTSNSNFHCEWCTDKAFMDSVPLLFCCCFLLSIFPLFLFLSCSLFYSFSAFLPCSCFLSPFLTFFLFSLFWVILSSILFHRSLSFLLRSLCLLKVLNKQTSSGWLASPIYNSSQANYSEDACQTHEIHLSASQKGKEKRNI